MAAHPSAADLIRLDRITVRQNGKTLLKELSWRVRRGEHWAVLGRNGSGKTTLLNVINGYLWPAAGSGPVEVLGERFGACDLPELRRRIGWVSSALHEGLERWHRVRRVVLSGKFAALGWVREATGVDEQRAERLLEQLGCADLADRPYGSLSQGEQQRVLIARALMAEPQLLLLDEPCAGLDFVAREQVLRAIEAMIGDCSGPAVVLVTHHAEEILPGISHVLLLEGGRAVAQGPKEQVLTAATLQVAFGVPLTVSWYEGRPLVRVERTSGPPDGASVEIAGGGGGPAAPSDERLQPR